MKPENLPSAVLVALGLAACRVKACLSYVAPDSGEHDSGDTDVGPCLDYALDTDDSAGDTDVGPCLAPKLDSDSGVGPCLDYALDTDDSAGDTDTGVGPCLEPPVDSADTGADTGDGPEDTALGPCLDYAPHGSAAPDGAPSQAADAPPPGARRGAVTARLLTRGVLPEDVADRLARALRDRD